MEAFLQDLLSGTTAPVLTALLLGLLTAISPCPLATNIAAVSYIGSDVADRKQVFRKGLAYTLGRTVSYTVLGIVLILILKAGASFFHLQKFLSEYGEKVLGPLLIVFGVFFFSPTKSTSAGAGAPRNGTSALPGAAFGVHFCWASSSPWLSVRPVLSFTLGC